MTGSRDEDDGARRAGKDPTRKEDVPARRTDREARLAEALRANLRRRKSAARAAAKDRD